MRRTSRGRPGTFALAAVVLLAAALIAGVVVSRAAGTGVIHSCVKSAAPNKGTVRILDPGVVCPAGYGAVDWNITGPPGPRVDRSVPTPNSTALLDAPDVVGYYSSATIGSDGLGLVAYQDNTNSQLDVAHCSDARCSSATVTPLGSAGVDFLSVTLGSDGLGLIAFIWNGLNVAHCSDIACTAANTTPVDSQGGGDASIVIGTDGFGLVSYRDNLNGALKTAHCSNVACSSATTATVEASGAGTWGTAITVGGDGLGLIAYSATAGLKAAHCTNAACSSVTTFVLDGGGTGHPAIATEVGGLSVVTYSKGGLAAAHCSNIECSAATTAILDGFGSSGLGSSVTIGADDLPVISYEDGVNHYLHVAHCLSTACSTASTVTVDATLYVGGYGTSVTIGTDGLPLITYQDYTNGDLRALHCASPFCVPYFRRR